MPMIPRVLFAIPMSVSLAALAAAPTAHSGGFDRRVVAPGESLAVLAVGPTSRAGEPAVLLIPGPVGSAHSVRLLVGGLLARGVTVRVVDPLGMGQSSRPDAADYSLGQQAVRLLQVTRAELPGVPVVVAGIGTSATIALHMAATAPNDIVGVVSLAGGPMDQQATKMMRIALAVSPLLDNPVGRALARRRFVSSMKAQSASSTWMTDSVVKAYTEPIEHDLGRVFRALRAMAAAHERVPIADRLPRITAPLRLLVGDTPTPSAPTSAQVDLFRRTVADFQVDTIKQAGTMLQEEQPAAVVTVIEALVRGARARKNLAPPSQLDLFDKGEAPKRGVSATAPHQSGQCPAA
jgi:pimeloyl-ACP methyl ester carboxylesterase